MVMASWRKERTAIVVVLQVVPETLAAMLTLASSTLEQSVTIRFLLAAQHNANFRQLARYVELPQDRATLQSHALAPLVFVLPMHSRVMDRAVVQD